MKLNPHFLFQEMGEDSFVLVPVEAAADGFHGIVRLNKTAAFIVECLGEETTEEKIMATMAQKYEGSREQFAASLQKTLDSLRQCGALLE